MGKHSTERKNQLHRFIKTILPLRGNVWFGRKEHAIKCTKKAKI